MRISNGHIHRATCLRCQWLTYDGTYQYRCLCASMRREYDYERWLKAQPRRDALVGKLHRG